MVCDSVLASNSTVSSVHISNKRLGWENDHDDNIEDDIDNDEDCMKSLPCRSKVIAINVEESSHRRSKEELG